MDANLGEVVLVKDIKPGLTEIVRPRETPVTPTFAPSSSGLGNFLEFNDKLYFSADDGVNGNELFVSDGTGSGTQLLADIYPGVDQTGFTYSSNPSELTEFNDKFYFSANDGESGQELFVSDGTTEGTQLLADLYPGVRDDGYTNSSFPGDFAELNGKLYFTANDGKNGYEIFVTDGTTEGTQLLTDLNPGVSEGGIDYSYFPSYLTEYNGKIYFSEDNGESGRELYVTDGTAEGTQLLADLNPGIREDGFNNSSNPGDFSDFVEFNDLLYFAATNREHGTELYVTDGTTEGTQLVADIYPGVRSDGYGYSSNPSELTVVGNELFFSADNGETGTELFKLTVNDGFGVEIPQVEVPQVDSSDALEDFLEGNGNGSFIDDDGNNVFVLNAEDKYDTIFDFDLGSDRLGLTDGLQFNDLSFAGNNILAGEEILTTLDGINTELLTASDFETI